jgi:hypothetical protein
MGVVNINGRDNSRGWGGGGEGFVLGNMNMEILPAAGKVCERMRMRLVGSKRMRFGVIGGVRRRSRQR